MLKGADGEERTRSPLGELTEERLEQVLRSQPRKQAPAGLWERIARSLSPEAVAGRRLARRRRRLAEVGVAVAASVVLVLGVWLWWGPSPSAPVPVERRVVEGTPEPTSAPLEVVTFDQEAETLGQVHLAYEAGNVLSIGSVGQEEMVVVVGYGDETW